MNGPQGGLNEHGHLDPDVVAEFRAGLITDRGLAGRRGRAISAHLSACAACAALDARLARVSALLAAAPVPAVPSAVAHRLDSTLAALAAESQNPISVERSSVHPTPRRVPSGADGSRDTGSRETGSRDTGSRDTGSLDTGSRDDARWSRRVWRARLLAPAAAALAALAGAGYGLSQLPSSSTSSTPTTASGAGAGSSAEYRAPGTSVAPGAAGATAAGGSSTFSPERRQGVQNPNGTYSEGNQVVVVASNLDYQPATWRDQVEAQLRASHTLPTGRASAPVTACVLHATNGSPRLLVETARYRGAPATVIVVPGAGADVALVAGPGCSATNSDILARAVLSSGTSAP
jgi:hypothetical protein